jgi:hypothetical protein
MAARGIPGRVKESERLDGEAFLFPPVSGPGLEFPVLVCSLPGNASLVRGALLWWSFTGFCFTLSINLELRKERSITPAGLKAGLHEAFRLF